MAVYFDTTGRYIESCTSVQQKIIAIENVILKLIGQLGAPSDSNSDNISEYQLNDGQTIIREVYRGTKGITEAINALQIQKQFYINQLNGRVHRAVDSKAFRRHGIW